MFLRSSFFPHALGASPGFVRAPQILNNTMRPKISEHRCPRCEIRKPLCFCDLIPRIELKTRVIVLMHTLEQPSTTNTAKLAHKALVNSELQVHGLKDQRLSADSLHDPNRTSLLLYPSPFAQVLDAQFVSSLTKPVTLIVPDACWRQTIKFVRREPAIAGIPHVRLEPGPPSEYRLRTQPRKTGVCTLEAIARSLGVLESREAQSQLEHLLRIMVERTLWSRGVLRREECVISGIPAAALRHDLPDRSNRRR